MIIDSLIEMVTYYKEYKEEGLIDVICPVLNIIYDYDCRNLNSKSCASCDGFELLSVADLLKRV